LVEVEVYGTLDNVAKGKTAVASSTNGSYGAERAVDGTLSTYWDAAVTEWETATEEQLPEIKDFYTRVFFEDVSDIHLYSNVIPVLCELKRRGYALTIATNRRRQMIISLLELLGINTFFEKIVCETDVKNKKPSADMVEVILEELNFSTDETLVLGDTKYDILMGQNANCKSCYVCHSKEVDESVIGLCPDIVVHDFQELMANKI
jgi:phosphoglycolate phosphatase